MIGDEDPLHIELQRLLAVRVEEIERLRAGDEDQTGIVDLALGLEMQGRPGLVEGVRDVVVELGVLLRLDLALGARPIRRWHVTKGKLSS